MVAPTSRLLELLELLQTQSLATGREIADRLGIDRRTVRRYIAALQELDIPVEGQRGVGGGYRIRPGFRLPPLMLTDDEAVVVALGLVAARHLGLDTASQPVDGASAKAKEDGKVGEIASIPAGKSSAVTLDLAPGKYVFICNIASHYQLGMHAGFTVDPL